MILTETVKATFKDASEKLTGHRKRDFIAKVSEDYFDGSARKAETVMEGHCTNCASRRNNL